MDTHDTPESSQNQTFLLGAIAVEAGLSAGTREVAGVWVDADMDYRKIEPVRRAAKARRIELTPLSRQELDARVGHDKHGGVVAEVGPRTFLTLDELLAHSGSERSFFVMLDGVEDPFNFGQSIRSLYAAGCHGVVVRPRNWAMADGEAPSIIARSSAGTSEFMPIALAETPEEAAEFFKAKGVVVAAAAETHEAVPLYDVDLTKPLFLLIGGEKRGVKRSFLNQADQVVQIPYGRPFEYALGTVAAVSVLGFELARQRGGK
ncbi:TrmH family RNA methyltransferase [Algisphaera agarilytica]|uniref:23S rRNA (Guanosine2251-2'-O)-methyltransferase n=1 Tax=Algisphaera agarilytica TaxID=1385975 RepID=A0A7X0LKC0_9BACT|nr:RNA methyltransferase [Algisphaera agarilytica]MBB6429767.1 23S rRNA (guanosine2251-2'-O)-methyltransferase [Algisphaera agarilytica]